MKIGIYPGTFDPITKGHMDIILRGTKIVDKLIIAVLQNSSKTPLFTVDQRIDMIEKATEDLDNVSVQPFNGLLVDFAKKENANIVLRGLRGVSDFEYEMQMAQTNRNMYTDLDTIFLATDNKYSYISSSLVKEIIKHEGPYESLIPSAIIPFIK